MQQQLFLPALHMLTAYSSEGQNKASTLNLNAIPVLGISGCRSISVFTIFNVSVRHLQVLQSVFLSNGSWHLIQWT